MVGENIFLAPEKIGRENAAQECKFWSFPHYLSRIQINHVFKAKRKRFVNSAAFSRKWSFLRSKPLFGEIPVLGRNSCLFGRKGHFSGSGPPKHLPEPYVYQGFYAGGPEVAFWPKKGTSGLRNGKNGGIPLFLLKWACYLILYRAT